MRRRKEEDEDVLPSLRSPFFLIGFDREEEDEDVLPSLRSPFFFDLI